MCLDLFFASSHSCFRFFFLLTVYVSGSCFRTLASSLLLLLLLLLSYKGLNQRSNDVTRTQSQRRVSPTVTLTSHASKYKVHNYIKSTKSTMAGKPAQFGLEDAHIQTRPHSTHILLTFKLQEPPYRDV